MDSYWPLFFALLASKVTFSAAYPEPYPPVAFQGFPGDKVVRLSWGANARTLRSAPPDDAVIVYKSTDGNNFTALRFPFQSAWEDSNVVNGVTYHYKVQFTNQAGAGRLTLPLALTPTATSSNGRPDFIIVQLMPTADPARAGMPISFHASIQNLGGRQSPYPFPRLKVEANGQILPMSFFESSPLAGGSGTFDPRGAYWKPAAGVYEIVAEIDADKTIDESNETNNRFVLSMNVLPALPDGDGDGSSDDDETFAGTDKLHPDSYLRISRVQALLPRGVRVFWPALPGKKYQLMFKQYIDEPYWRRISPIMEAAAAEISYTDDAFIPSPKWIYSAENFYRVSIVQ